MQPCWFALSKWRALMRMQAAGHAQNGSIHSPVFVTVKHRSFKEQDQKSVEKLLCVFFRFKMLFFHACWLGLGNFFQLGSSLNRCGEGGGCLSWDGSSSSVKRLTEMDMKYQDNILIKNILRILVVSAWIWEKIQSWDPQVRHDAALRWQPSVPAGTSLSGVWGNGQLPCHLVHWPGGRGGESTVSSPGCVGTFP